MACYFKQKQLKKLKLSEYLKLDKSKCEYFLCSEKYRAPRTKYIMEIIGDVEFDEETYELFLKQWQCSGGMYDVRTKRETIKGIYDISQKFPFLTALALDEIWFRYISDLFEEYYLLDTLEIFFERFGKKDKTFKLFLCFIDQIAREHHKKYVNEAQKLESLEIEYSKMFVSYLQDLIIEHHFSFDKIKKYLPSAEIIKKDEEQLKGIIESTRIYFGACDPVSYQMIKSSVTGEGLDHYPEQPQYCICETSKIDTMFTKQEFLESIEKTKIKKLEKK
jgi:hypothetical protein